MKAVSLLIDSLLPPDLRDPSRIYDKGSLDALLADVARKYPDRYSKIVQGIADVGRNASYIQGETLTLNDMRPVFDKDAELRNMDSELASADALGGTDAEKLRAQRQIWFRYADEMEKRTLKDALAQGNNLGNTVASKARGNPFQLKAMITTPALYTDYKNNPIDLFVRRSYGEGLRPYEYLASSYGVRKGIISTKSATAEAGDFCLHEDTLVRMADLSIKSLRDIQIGDWVLGADKLGNVFPAKVTNKFDQGIRTVGVYRVFVPGNRKRHQLLYCTKEHRFLTYQLTGDYNGKTEIRAIGEWTSQSSGVRPKIHRVTPKHPQTLKVSPGEWFEAHCLDLEVDHPDHLFVLACGLICSNSKQLTTSAANQSVTEDDCGTSNGLDFDVDDTELTGRVLAHDYGEVQAGTVIDRHIMGDLRRLGVKKVLARSPMTCSSREGLCAHCLGTLPTGKFAPLGYAAGITAAQGISEPIAQGSLSAKHGGGGFTGEKATYAGFDVINQLAQSPEAFPYRAAVSEKPGRVEKIEDAPQGGKYVFVGGEKHFTLPGMDINVKVGDDVEKGDQLSDGVMDVADVVRLRGLGEARRYYVDRMKQALEESGAGKPAKLNLEVLARASLDHVRVDDPDGVGDYLPDDTASYNRVSAMYSPPAETKQVAVESSVGHTLEVPALHYTIGTKLTPKMVKRIKDAGIGQVSTSMQEPKFTPDMSRLRAAAHSGTDWMAKMHSSYIGTNLQADAERGRDTSVDSNVHFAPRLMKGVGFGQKVEKTGEF